MKKRIILQYSLDGNFIQSHQSAKDAANSVGLASHAGIVNCCQEKPNSIQTKGFMWKYHDSSGTIPEVIDPARNRGDVFKETYGVGGGKHSEFIEKRKKTSKEKYGTDHHMKNAEFKKKFDSIIMDKWGVANIANHEDIRSKISNTERSRKSAELIGKFPDLDFIKVDSDIFTFYSSSCDHNFEINRQLLTVRAKNRNTICTVCNRPDSNVTSEIERFLSDEIEKNGILVERNIKGLVKSKHEIDIFLKDFSIGVEVNGIKFHNDSYGKGEKYHIDKTRIFNEVGISILHFFDDEISEKTDLVLSTIISKIGKSKRMFARKCKIGHVERIDAKKFLDENHLQGFVDSRYNIGLFVDGTLVSIMTFGSRRKSMGSVSKIGEWELLRFCNLKGHSVVGGASKLFSHFVKENDPIEVTSYANLRWSNGNLYEKLGFNLVSQTAPSYWYFYKNKRVHRYALRKQILVSMGHDPSKSESEIISDLQIPKIYDCGNLKYSWYKKNT
jgi:hypothetical protein